jgi:N-acetylgalactosamine-N,N'-diacetylbacillosaminyl-diphospho-undecaprenol 4-alpha-N-acetylgalactosaminyltransferase
LLQAEGGALKRRALFIINSLAGGGAERVMATLLRHSTPWLARYEIALALLDSEPAAYQIPSTVTVHQFDAKGGLLRSVLALRRVFADWQPDVVLSFLTRANVAAWIARRDTDMPLVMSERVNTSAHLSGWLGRRLVRLAYPRAEHIIAVSQGVADDLTAHYGVRGERITVLSNPVDREAIESAAAAEPLSVEGPYVAAMGRLVDNKNFAMLIDAFVEARIPGKLVIMGDGPLRAELGRRVKEHGAAGRIVLAGFVANPFPTLAAADLFVLPSNAEGFPNGLVEAMALGVPVISTNCASGPSEILADSPADAIRGLTFAEYGALVDTNDRSGLAAALRAFQDSSLRTHYGEAAQRRAEHYSADATVERYWRVLEDTMSGVRR